MLRCHSCPDSEVAIRSLVSFSLNRLQFLISSSLNFHSPSSTRSTNFPFLNFLATLLESLNLIFSRFLFFRVNLVTVISLEIDIPQQNHTISSSSLVILPSFVYILRYLHSASFDSV